jgi:hypothetical protein
VVALSCRRLNYPMDLPPLFAICQFGCFAERVKDSADARVYLPAAQKLFNRYPTDLPSRHSPHLSGTVAAALAIRGAPEPFLHCGSTVSL